MGVGGEFKGGNGSIWGAMWGSGPQKESDWQIHWGFKVLL